MHDLGTLDGGGVNSSANGINDSGLAVGYAYTSAGYPHAFMYDSSMHDLGTLGGTSSDARAINAGGRLSAMPTPAPVPSTLFFTPAAR